MILDQVSNSFFYKYLNCQKLSYPYSYSGKFSFHVPFFILLSYFLDMYKNGNGGVSGFDPLLTDNLSEAASAENSPVEMNFF